VWTANAAVLQWLAVGRGLGMIDVASEWCLGRNSWLDCMSPGVLDDQCHDLTALGKSLIGVPAWGYLMVDPFCSGPARAWPMNPGEAPWLWLWPVKNKLSLLV